MAKKDALKRQADMMFIELGYNAKAIAEQLGVTEKTVGNWRRLAKWDTRRDELLASPHKLREILLKEMRSIADGNKSTFDTDALSKVNRVFEGFSAKMSPQIVMMVMMAYDNFLADTNPELANKNIESNKKFILHIINLHG